MTDQDIIEKATRIMASTPPADLIQALADAGLLADCHQTQRAVKAEAERDALAATVQRVRITHRQITLTGKCQACRKPWPCSTIRALDDPQEQP